MTSLIVTLVLAGGDPQAGQPIVIQPEPLPAAPEQPFNPTVPHVVPRTPAPTPQNPTVPQVVPEIPLPAPAPVPAVILPPRIPTHREFAATFKPLPGTYKVCMLHPKKCKPVEVCFTLPYGCGCPEVKVGRRYIKYDYGDVEVEIRFRIFGRVTVDYDD